MKIKELFESHSFPFKLWKLPKDIRILYDECGLDVEDLETVLTALDVPLTGDGVKFFARTGDMVKADWDKANHAFAQLGFTQSASGMTPPSGEFTPAKGSDGNVRIHVADDGTGALVNITHKLYAAISIYFEVSGKKPKDVGIADHTQDTFEKLLHTRCKEIYDNIMGKALPSTIKKVEFSTTDHDHKKLSDSQAKKFFTSAPARLPERGFDYTDWLNERSFEVKVTAPEGVVVRFVTSVLSLRKSKTFEVDTTTIEVGKPGEEKRLGKSAVAKYDNALKDRDFKNIFEVALEIAAKGK